MDCRPDCAACCTAASISTPMPGHPQGKPAGVTCVHLTADRRCSGLQPSLEMCGETREHALAYLTLLEEQTRPDR